MSLELVILILVPLIAFAAGHRVGYRVGKAEGRLLGRDGTEGRLPGKAGG